MKKIAYLLLVSLIFSCSSDENPSTTTNTQNGFTFDGIFYETQTLFIIDENSSDTTPGDISFSFINKTREEMISTNNLSNLNTFYFDFNAINAEATTYTEIRDYGCRVNATRVSGEISNGNVILSDNETSLEASSISVKIHSITPNNVDLSFTFTRTDGKVVTGKFIGNYLNISQLPVGPMPL